MGWIAGSIVAVSSAIGVLAAAVRRAWAAWRVLETLAEDWSGEPDRPGVPGRRGVMARLAAVEADGQATRDAAERTAADVSLIAAAVAQIATVVDRLDRAARTDGTGGLVLPLPLPDAVLNAGRRPDPPAA